MSKIKGIDVSKWQKAIDWKKVKADGIEFAIIRASLGKNDKDETFEDNYSEAKKTGIKVGAYHYCYASSVAEAKTEAENFLKAVKGKNFEYPLTVDMEDKSIQGLSKATLTDIANAFLNTVRDGGFNTMVYASKSWFDDKLDASKLGNHRIWIARYNDTLGYQGRYDLWQYSSEGKVDGISGNVDLDYCYTDVESSSSKTDGKAAANEDKAGGKVLSVKDIQKAINKKYGLNIGEDNKFGLETLEAITKALQTELNRQYKAGLKVDGIFGQDTSGKLITIKKGDKGNITFLLQALLICRGDSLSPYGADGTFGASTEQKVRSYQKDKGLSVDGIVGVNTWSKLLD